jgi:hypothetical protein
MVRLFKIVSFLILIHRIIGMNARAFMFQIFIHCISISIKYKVNV